MTVQELEDKVWALDGIRIVVRESANKKVKDYPQKKAAQSNWRITQFIDVRVRPLLKGQEVVVLMGDGEYPHGGTLLSSIKKSYIR